MTPFLDNRNILLKFSDSIIESLCTKALIGTSHASFVHNNLFFSSLVTMELHIFCVACNRNCCLRRLKGYPDGSASTAWDFAGLLCNLYRVASSKRCQHFETSRVESPLNPFYTWCNILLTGLHHFPIVSIPLLFP